jgi:3-dehydroquinate synthase
MKELNVKVPAVQETSYPIIIGSGLLSKAMKMVNDKFPRYAKFIVSDICVANAGLLKTLDPQGNIPKFIINPAGEQSKTIQTVISITEQMEKAYMGRDTVIIALGGGTVGDMAGFAAAIFKRGIPVVQIPTTTVAQADSSVGGKTGVDSTISKNAFGSFHHPAMVIIDVQTLTTLDDRQYMAGLIESVKHALIMDAEYFDFIESNIENIIARKTEILEAIAEKNCRIKASVVENDPTEKNQRRALNYGHTIGHAIESASNFDLLHGESIAIGIIAAGLIEEEMSLADNAQHKRIRNILARLNMPAKIPASISQQQIIELLKRDKKAVNSWPKFVLLEKIGKVHCIDNQWAIDVDEKLIRTILPKLY